MKSINIQRSGKASQSGFTIIELVVVILLLGILAATALPRFINVTDQAHTAAVAAVAGGLSTGSAMFRAEYVGRGGTGTSVPSFPNMTASSATGFPDITSAAGCVTAWNDLLQGGRPSLDSTGATAASTGAAYSQDLTGQTEDFFPVYVTAERGCVYLYKSNVISQATKHITYLPVTGNMDITN